MTHEETLRGLTTSVRGHQRIHWSKIRDATLAFLIPICEPKTGNFSIKASRVYLRFSGVSLFFAAH